MQVLIKILIEGRRLGPMSCLSIRIKIFDRIRIQYQPKALNDDLSLTLTVHQVAETRSRIDCPTIQTPYRKNNVQWTPY